MFSLILAAILQTPSKEVIKTQEIPLKVENYCYNYVGTTDDAVKLTQEEWQKFKDCSYQQLKKVQ